VKVIIPGTKTQAECTGRKFDFSHLPLLHYGIGMGTRDACSMSAGELQRARGERLVKENMGQSKTVPKLHQKVCA